MTLLLYLSEDHVTFAIRAITERALFGIPIYVHVVVDGQGLTMPTCIYPCYVHVWLLGLLYFGRLGLNSNGVRLLKQLNLVAIT